MRGIDKKPFAAWAQMAVLLLAGILYCSYNWIFFSSESYKYIAVNSSNVSYSFDAKESHLIIPGLDI